MAKRSIRQIRVEGNIAFVPLTQGREAVIDASDAPIVGAFNWRAQVFSRKAYAIKSDILQCGSRTTSSMHRLLMGYPAGLDIDHVNGDGLDNRRQNLRVASVAQNQWNRGASQSGACRYKGVDLHRGKWRARIKIQFKETHLGYFDSPEDAAAAYVAASKTLHKEFSYFQ